MLLNSQFLWLLTITVLIGIAYIYMCVWRDGLINNFFICCVFCANFRIAFHAFAFCYIFKRSYNFQKKFNDL